MVEKIKYMNQKLNIVMTEILKLITSRVITIVIRTKVALTVIKIGKTTQLIVLLIFIKIALITSLLFREI